MERFLITHSLLSAYDYLFDCYEGGEEKAYEDFLRTLNREPSEQTDAMRDGCLFESLVYDRAAGRRRLAGKPEWEHGVDAVASYLIGAPTQLRIKREIEVDGMLFLVYGVLDCLKAGTIYDVKFKAKPFAKLELAGSYLGKTQHPTYFHLVPEARRFEYLVSDGEDLYTEGYDREDTPPVSLYISRFISGITQMGLLETYKNKWLAL